MKDPASPGEFRIMTRKDLPEVLEIERRSFRLPWDEGRFLLALQGSDGSRCVVVHVAKQLVGYFVLEIEAERTHLVNLAIHPDYRRRGLASRCLALIDQVALRTRDLAQSPIEQRALTRRRTTPQDAESAIVPLGTVPAAGGRDAGEIYLEVEESNLAAQLLYRKMGFRATDVLRNHYPAFAEDGYRMVRKIRASTTHPLHRSV